MIILSIDTTGPVAGCAISIDGRIVSSAALDIGLTHSETIMPLVDKSIEQSGIRLQSLDVIAAVAGPGSFTGVRIGICAAKGLAQALGKPCAPINSLEALAMNFPYSSSVICPLLDARRDQVYCAAYDTSSGFPAEIIQGGAESVSEFIKRLPDTQKYIFLGDGAIKHFSFIESILGKRAFIAPYNLRALRPDAACVLAEKDVALWIEPKYLKPIYFRAPQAERERNARLATEIK